MALELIILVKDTKQDGDCFIKLKPAPPAAAMITCLRSLRKLGYPLRNTVTQLLRELLMLKMDIDLYGEAIRSTDTRGSAARVGAGKAPDSRKALLNPGRPTGLQEA